MAGSHVCTSSINVCQCCWRTGHNQFQEIQSAELTCWSSSEEEPGQEGVLTLLSTSTQVYTSRKNNCLSSLLLRSN
ncbi:hypothetical protein CY34DRAFT_810632 [Suillus luteus UH-Slu-Lm8-n1]|uniref:Uncharacterized protein n=1 Tax=Suillus luteus UH-Slu-Lm8-n1 TaxID=930992 RepID=A0A0D0ASB8_9AGAM|nr:hypothetical protein CY34DRAFT_810632 [Suillus luteus UH-Slu-Lm8-n1]